MSGMIDHMVTLVLGSLFGVLVESRIKRLWRRVIDWFTPSHFELEPGPGRPDESAPGPGGRRASGRVDSSAAVSLAEFKSVCGDADRLEDQLGRVHGRRRDLERQLNRLRRERSDNPAVRQDMGRLCAVLFEMPFLTPGRSLGEFELTRKLAEGEASQIWVARAPGTARPVVVRVLRYTHSLDASTVAAFVRAAHLLSQHQGLGGPSIVGGVTSVIPAQGPRLHYYAMAYVDGPSLAEYRPRSWNARRSVVQEILHLGRRVHGLHDAEVVHCDIKPGHIVMSRDGAALTLVDFTSAIDAKNPQPIRPRISVHEGLAPELMTPGATVDRRADVFGLARTIAHVFDAHPQSVRNPDPYAFDLLDRLECGWRAKRVLQRALDPRVEYRHPSLDAFADDLFQALEAEDERTPLGQAVRICWGDIRRALGYAALGTVIGVLIARPALLFVKLALEQWQPTTPPAALWPPWQPAHLSDSVPVAAFHAIVGGLTWGTLIPAAFLLHWIRLGRAPEPRSTLTAAVLCAFAGFLGGLVTGSLSTLVSNPLTMADIGWFNDIYTNKGNRVVLNSGERFRHAIEQTRMFWAFPLTGTLSGLASGLFLNKRLNRLLAEHVSGLVPVPIKRMVPEDGLVRDALRLVFEPRLLSYLTLFLPVLGFWLCYFVLRPSGVPPGVPPFAHRWFFDKWILLGALPSLGEGIIHTAGAFGLCTGFLLGVARRRTTSPP